MLNQELPQQRSYSTPLRSSGCKKQVNWPLLCLRPRKVKDDWLLQIKPCNINI